MKTLTPTAAGAAVFSADDIDRFLAAEFGHRADTLSAPYVQGVRAMLMYRLAGAALPRLPYPLGSAEADAYFAGQGQAREIARSKQGGAS